MGRFNLNTKTLSFVSVIYSLFTLLRLFRIKIEEEEIENGIPFSKRLKMMVNTEHPEQMPKILDFKGFFLFRTFFAVQHPEHRLAQAQSRSAS